MTQDYSAGEAAQEERTATVLAFPAFKDASAPLDKNDFPIKNQQGNVFFNRHELQAIFNVRAQYPNVSKDYVLVDTPEKAICALLHEAGCADEVVAVLKSEFNGSPLYMALGPDFDQVSSTDIEDIAQKIADHFAPIEASYQSDMQARNRRRSFSIVS